MRDVAATAGIDPAMVLRYFGSKEALFVAVTIRMFVRIGLVPPTFTNSRPCTTRSSLACSGMLSSHSSSMKSVPPSACENTPSRFSMAPVYDPTFAPALEYESL